MPVIDSLIFILLAGARSRVLGNELQPPVTMVKNWAHLPVPGPSRHEKHRGTFAVQKS
jgi:hypothetical protein